MEILNCASCGKTADMSCARCKSAAYCSRACQRSHWSTHKQVCSAERGRDVQRTNWVMCANARISGNLFIMASHRYEIEGPGVIFAEISETIEEFMKGKSMHFAHLSFARTADCAAFAAEKYDLHITSEIPNIDTSHVVVVYVLKDYHCVFNITPDNTVNLKTLKDEYPTPDNGWSVIFTL